jgi:hypothetical protein
VCNGPDEPTVVITSVLGCFLLLILQNVNPGDASSPLFYSFDLEYVIRKVQGNQARLNMNETHQLLVSANAVNVFGPA